MNDKYNKYKDQELPDFIINAVSDIINQYILEHAVKDKNIILRFSKFSEFLTVKIQEGLINAHNTDFNNKEYVCNLLTERKKLINLNKDLYKQLDHLSMFNIPDYLIDSIVLSVIEIQKEEEDFSEIENRDFYGRFGENIVLDIRNYMQLEQANKNR